MIRNLENNLEIPAEILVLEYPLADALGGEGSAKLAKTRPRYGGMIKWVGGIYLRNIVWFCRSLCTWYAIFIRYRSIKVSYLHIIGVLVNSGCEVFLSVFGEVKTAERCQVSLGALFRWWPHNFV
jgi:hypothetical protein